MRNYKKYFFMKPFGLTITTITLFLVCPVVFWSCKKLDQAPSDRFTDLTYWTTPDHANSVLNMAYSQMFRDDYFFYNEGLSDNAYNGRNDVDNTTSIANGSYNAALPRFDQEWSYHYAGIKTCNVLLDNIGRISNYPALQKSQVIAQARFIRAFHYLQLTTWFGDVPLFQHDISYSQSVSIKRTPHAQVLSFILGELDSAAAVLPVNTAYGAGDQGRVTKGAALALKARAQLYENDWNGVSATCGNLINGAGNGTYGLVARYDSVFSPYNEHNSEVMLDLEYVPIQRTYADLFDMVPISVGARDNALAPTQELVNDYVMLNGMGINDPGSGYNPNNPYNGRDPRMTSTVVYHQYQWKNAGGSTRTIYIKPGSDPNNSRPDEYSGPSANASPTGYYTRKYFDPSSQVNFKSGLDLILIRYADVLLMYAEARNELGNVNAGVWNQTIGALRIRAGFTDPGATQFNAALSKDSLRSIIRRERRCELAMEGLRVFDIRRWKTAEVVLNGWAHGAQYGDPATDNGFIRLSQRTFSSRNYLWPVPNYETAQNPNLTQNPGW